MIYKENFKIGLKDIGKENKVKNSAILEFLEDIGGHHSDLVGYGVNEIEETKVTWILLDWKLEVIDRPAYGEELEIHTWGRGMYKFFTYRDYEIYDKNKKLRAKATSKWALIDIKSGRLARLTEEIINKYLPEEKSVFPEKELDKVEEPEDSKSALDYTVIRKDIDLNKHMHNLYYLDLAYEALPEEVYEKRPFANVRIVYKKEIKLGDEVICNYAQKADKNVITIRSKDNQILHSIIELY